MQNIHFVFTHFFPEQNQSPSKHKPDMHGQHNNRTFQENEEKFPVDHPRKEEMPRDTWRTYNDVHPEAMDDVPNNEMHPENGNFHHNPDMQHGFDPRNDMGPPSRGRPDRFPPHQRRDEEFLPDDVPPRGGPPPFNNDIFPGEDMDLRNNHMGPGPGPEDMDYMAHKRSWIDGPNREDRYRPSRDFDGPPNYNPRQYSRQNQRFQGPPRGGPRGSYRGIRHSPYKVINRGRGRGGYN